MFCHINYKIDKNYYRKFFWENQKQNMDYWSGIDKTWVEYTNYIIQNNLTEINDSIIRNEGLLKSLKNDN